MFIGQDDEGNCSISLKKSGVAGEGLEFSQMHGLDDLGYLFLFLMA